MQKLIRADSWLPLLPRRTQYLQPVFLFNCLSVICTPGTGRAQQNQKAGNEEQWTVNHPVPWHCFSLALLHARNPFALCKHYAGDFSQLALHLSFFHWVRSLQNIQVAFVDHQSRKFIEEGGFHSLFFNKDTVSPYNPGSRKICSFCHLEPRTQYVK